MVQESRIAVNGVGSSPKATTGLVFLCLFRRLLLTDSPPRGFEELEWDGAR
jgi:hypothetical protein